VSLLRREQRQGSPDDSVIMADCSDHYLRARNTVNLPSPAGPTSNPQPSHLRCQSNRGAARAFQIEAAIRKPYKVQGTRQVQGIEFKVKLHRSKVQDPETHGLKAPTLTAV